MKKLILFLTSILFATSLKAADFNIDAKDFFYPEPKKTDEAPLPTEGGEVWQKTSLPPTSMPKVAQIPPQTNPQTGLTRTESALLSPSEQVIARRS